MKSLNQKHQSLSNSIEKLGRQQFIIFTLFLITAGCYGWLKISQSDSDTWDETIIKLPNSEQLQLKIDAQVTHKTDIDQQLNDNLDDIIDDQAMQIKLSGLTRNVTVTREPTPEELSNFYTQYKAQYRQLSTFHFTQYLFPTIKYGGQAVNIAHQMLNTAPEKRAKASDRVSLNTLEVDRLYGAGFSKKLEGLVLQDSQKLPCWTKPITSKIGAHLICFKQVSLGSIPKLDSIKPQLINHWRHETLKQQSIKK